MLESDDVCPLQMLVEYRIELWLENHNRWVWLRGGNALVASLRIVISNIGGDKSFVDDLNRNGVL